MYISTDAPRTGNEYSDAVNYLDRYALEDLGVISNISQGFYKPAPYRSGKQITEVEDGVAGGDAFTPNYQNSSLFSSAGRVAAQADSGNANSGGLDPGTAIGIGAGIGLIGDYIGAGSYASGQAAANSANKQMAYNQMRFQELMSSTAHSREVKDLQRAGLNPALSVNAGASSPSGASAAISNAAPDYRGFGSRIMANLSTAAEAKRLIGTVENLKQSTREIEERTRVEEQNKKVLGEEVRKRKAEADITEVESEFYKKNPEYMQWKKGVELFAPVVGAARDIGILFKNFGYNPKYGKSPDSKGKDIRMNEDIDWRIGGR